MTQDKYLIALAAVAGVAMFLVGVYAMEYSSDEDEENDENMSGDTVEITSTMQNGLAVMWNDEPTSSGVPFMQKAMFNLR
ncbi:MAG: hypothetical protein FWG96_06335 [Methanomassiliicoccaceae archaeon]|nr:hypothetical protein [Methanomassiliicoccaceae archaeon]